MATYTLTIDLTDQTFPVDTFFITFGNTCINNWDNVSTIEDAAENIQTYFEDLGGNCVYLINENVLTLNVDIDYCGGPVVLQFDSVLAPFIPTIITPCPNCQPLAITNCGPVDISLPIPDDDYTVTLYDNQSGVSYTQNVQWTSGTGTWNISNTAGVFTPFSIFTLTVTDSEGTPVSWPVGPDEYTCARVTFSATVDTNDAG